MFVLLKVSYAVVLCKYVVHVYQSNERLMHLLFFLTTIIVYFQSSVNVMYTVNNSCRPHEFLSLNVVMFSNMILPSYLFKCGTFRQGFAAKLKRILLQNKHFNMNKPLATNN